MTEWKFVSTYDLDQYPCGVKAGSIVKLKERLDITDWQGNMLGEVFERGSEWTVLNGVSHQPTTVWLRDPSGQEHTWDDATFWASFESSSEREN